MADVVNKSTLEYRKSAHTPDYPEADWLINPELPDCDPAFWVLDENGTGIREMTHDEKVALVQQVQAERAAAEWRQQKYRQVRRVLRDKAAQWLLAAAMITQEEHDQLIGEATPGAL